ncbi:MAG: helix-turn-helix transcriptional regulator [Acidothermaceae bacterium]
MQRSVRRDWHAVEALSEPTRRRVYDAVRAARRPMTRDDIAADLGIGRPLAAFHLDALAKAGLLDVDYARPPGRRGPGAGRPSKRYRTAAADIRLNVPERRYELVAQVLAEGVRDAAASGDVRAAVFEAARARGEQLGRQCAGSAALAAEAAGAAGAADTAGVADTAGAADTVTDPAVDATPRARVCSVLDELGYEPADDGDAISLRNCPFHGVVDVEPELVCRLNLRLLEGLLDALPIDDLEARFVPTAEHCCVQVREVHSGRVVG